MNYNIIYDSKHKKYYDINSKEGTELIETLCTFIKHNKQTHNTIDKAHFNNKAYTLQLLPLGSMKYKLSYTEYKEKKLCLKKDYEHILLYILHLFVQDNLYSSINLYQYIYTIYKIKKNISKNYKLITIHTTGEEEAIDDEESTDEERTTDEEESTDEEDTNNPLENIINKELLVNKYNKLYKDTQHIVQFILNPNHAFILYNIHHLLDIDTYTRVVRTCIKKNFIKKNNKA